MLTKQWIKVGSKEAEDLLIKVENRVQMRKISMQEIEEMVQKAEAHLKSQQFPKKSWKGTCIWNTCYLPFRYNFGGEYTKVFCERGARDWRIVYIERAHCEKKPYGIGGGTIRMKYGELLKKPVYERIENSFEL